MPRANTFQRPSHGAILDVSELEYVSFLHRSSPAPSPNDGSVTSHCVVSLLRSRHGIEVSEEDVEELLMGDLAGDPRGGEESERVLDMVTLCGLLLVPFLKGEVDREEEKDGGDSGGVVEREWMERVVEVIKRDLGRSPSDDVELTPSVVKELFEGYGEKKSCPHGVRDMLRHAREATGRSDADVLMLDAGTLLRILAYDLGVYDAGWEDAHSTHWGDFLSTVEGGMSALDGGLRGKPAGTDDGTDLHNDDDDDGTPTSRILRLARNRTFSTVDLTSDAFRSDSYFVLLFLSMMLGYLSFAKTNIVGSAIDCDGNFACGVGESVLSWLVTFLYLGLLGGSYLLFASAGNSAGCDCPTYAKVLGSLVVVGFVVLPFWGYGPPGVFRTRDEAEGYLVWSSYLCVVTGVVLVQRQAFHMAGGLFGKSRFKRWLDGRSLIRKKERDTKRAAGFKTGKIVRHALSIHAMGETGRHGDTAVVRKPLIAQNEAMLNYAVVTNDPPETVGGFLWFWRDFTRTRAREGVWVSARMLAGQIGQILALFAFAFVLGYGLRWIDTGYDDGSGGGATISVVLEGGVRSLYFNATGSYVYSAEAVDEEFLGVHGLTYAYDLDRDLDAYVEGTKEKTLKMLYALFAMTQEATTAFGYDRTPSDLLDSLSQTFYDATGLDLDNVLDYVESVVDYDGPLLFFFVARAKKRVSRPLLRTSVAVGGSVGLLAVLSATLAFLPSYASSVMRFRSGVGPSPLSDPRFAELKRSQWEPVQLFGTTFWSALFSGAAATLLGGGATFLILWEETREYAHAALAGAVGVSVSWGLKRTVLLAVRERVFDGFYRKDLVLGNLVTIVMEAWHVGLTLGFVSARALLLLVTSCVYVGRVDTPLLAPSVNFFGLAIDNVHTPFYADLLLHEAHRHPYIERLVVLYMLKMHHGSRFLVVHGSRWRLLFVLALVPWLRRYRAREMRLTDVDRIVREKEAEEKKIL